MAFELMNLNSGAVERYAVNDILKCNDYTADFGLTLTAAQATELVKTRTGALQANGRVELGGGVIDKIILAFAASPYITADTYTQTLHELIELFYYYKNESLDLVGDDDLIDYMEERYNGVCQGSLELLEARELERMARNVRFGYKITYDPDKEGADVN